MPKLFRLFRIEINSVLMKSLVIILVEFSKFAPIF